MKDKGTICFLIPYLLISGAPCIKNSFVLFGKRPWSWIGFTLLLSSLFFYRRRSRFAKHCTTHNRIKYLGFLFFARVKYFRCVWRCMLVIACLILQSLIKPKVQQILVKLQLQSIGSERSWSNFLPKLNTKNIANTCTCFKVLKIVIVLIVLSQILHIMVITTLKTLIAKLSPKNVVYKDYENVGRG